MCVCLNGPCWYTLSHSFDAAAAAAAAASDDDDDADEESLETTGTIPLCLGSLVRWWLAGWRVLNMNKILLHSVAENKNHFNKKFHPPTHALPCAVTD